MSGIIFGASVALAIASVPAWAGVIDASIRGQELNMRRAMLLIVLGGPFVWFLFAVLLLVIGLFAAGLWIGGEK